MNDNQILVVHSRGVYNFMGLIYVALCIPLFHCSVMHSLKKKLFQILPHFSGYVHLKKLIRLHALRVSKTKGYSLKSGTSFVELAVNGRISIYNKERQTSSHYQC